MSRLFLMLGTFSAALGVAAGAFGAHALRARVEPRLLEVFETGARYQMYHALALIAVASLLTRSTSRTPRTAGQPTTATTATTATTTHSLAVASGWCFVAGTVLFSGSLYAMAITGVSALGAITPVGGVCFIAGWVGLAVAAARAG